MRSAHVTVNLDKVDTNILMVNLNGSRIKPFQLYDMLLKVSTDAVFDTRTYNAVVQGVFWARVEKSFRWSCAVP